MSTVASELIAGGNPKQLEANDVKLNEAQLKQFWHWVNERENIRIRREAGEPFPWTRDDILRTYRFCNVRREDDRVTRWIRTHIREPYADHDNLWFMLAIARHLNLPASIERLLNEGLWPVAHGNLKAYNAKKICNVLNKFSDDGNNVFNAAYIINAAQCPTGWTKIDHVFKNVLQAMWNDRANLAQCLTGNMEFATKSLMKYRGIGGFMAYQIAIDLSWTKWLEKASDLDTWSIMGPGSKRGINRLLRKHPYANLSTTTALEVMLELYSIQHRFVKDYVGHIRLSDIQNCLCEFDKYMRAQTGKGKPKQRFKPHD